MIIYLSDPKNLPRELLQLINNFSNVDGYKFNLNKSIASLHTNDKQAEKENRKTTTFKIVMYNIKNLGVTLIKQVKDLLDKSF